MFIFLWIFVGLLCGIVNTYIQFKAYDEIDLGNVCVAMLLTIGGIVSIVILLLVYSVNNDIIVYKKKI